MLDEWGGYWDTSKDFLLEKSPPNLVRTRFLQKIFPTSRFIVILRHLLAVSYATQKWSNTNIKALIEHCLLCYERFHQDVPFLNKVYILRYEDFIANPHRHIQTLLDWIKLEPFEIQKQI